MKNLKIEDLKEYRSLSEITFSPDGKNAAYVVHETDLEENKYLTNIWIYNVEEKNSRKLTACGSGKNIVWLDKDTLMFPGNRTGKELKADENGQKPTVFYIINIKGGEAEEYMTIPLSVEKISPITRNNFVFQAKYTHYKPESSCQIIDEIPFWFNGKGFVNKVRSRLYTFNRYSQDISAVSDAFEDVKIFKIKDHKIYYSFTSYDEIMKVPEKLYSYDMNTKKYESLIPEDTYKIYGFDFIRDALVIAASDMKEFDLNQNPDFYIAAGKAMKIISSPDLGMGNSVVSDCRLGTNRSFKASGDYLYFITTKNSNSFLAKMGLDGKIQFLTEEAGSIDGFDIYENNILFVGMRNGGLQELYALEGFQEIKVTGFNSDILSSRNFSTPSKLDFINKDGIKIEGFIMKPIGYQEGKNYPAILNIHGGPKAAYGDVFCHEMQFWANKGYFVFFCNPRGSEGRGNEFADLRGKYGSIDYDDLMEFTDKVIDRHPEIDINRIAVTGGSYGGFMVNWIIGHTNRFVCAASQRSISNWISKLTTTDIGYYHNSQQQQADPWSNHEKLWHHSPLKYADKAKTPTLFIHSDEDYRCWLSEPLQMFTALKLHGVPARMCLFNGENHELSRSGKPQNRVRRILEITNWVDKYAKL